MFVWARALNVYVCLTSVRVFHCDSECECLAGRIFLLLN